MKKKISTAEDCQKKAAKALLDDWANMQVFANHADADEPLDPTEAQDYIMSAVQNLAAGEEESALFEEGDTLFGDIDGNEKTQEVSDASPPVTQQFDTKFPDLFESVLCPSEAKQYARSAAPTYRGKMCLNILRITNGYVFA